MHGLDPDLGDWVKTQMPWAAAPLLKAMLQPIGWID
jgi:hypothetical protein